MLNTPDPEQANGGTAVTITDLDAPQTGHVPGSAPRRGHVPVLPARLWMRIALLGGTVLLVLLILAQVPHPYEPAAMGGGTLPAAPYLSLSSADGIAYASSPDGMVWAMRLRDGFLLWHHAGRGAIEASTTVAGGVLFLALRATDGFPLWRSSSLIPPSSVPPVAVNGIVLIMLQDGSMEAFRARNGAVLWHYFPPSPLTESLPLVTGGVVYVSALDGSISALRASSGSLLWHRTLHAYLASCCGLQARMIALAAAARDQGISAEDQIGQVIALER